MDEEMMNQATENKAVVEAFLNSRLGELLRALRRSGYDIVPTSNRVGYPLQANMMPISTNSIGYPQPMDMVRIPSYTGYPQRVDVEPVPGVERRSWFEKIKD